MTLFNNNTLDVVATSRGESHQRRESQHFSQNFILLKVSQPDLQLWMGIFDK